MGHRWQREPVGHLGKEVSGSANPFLEGDGRGRPSAEGLGVGAQRVPPQQAVRAGARRGRTGSKGPLKQREQVTSSVTGARQKMHSEQRLIQ